MTAKFDLLVYMSLVLFVAVIAIAAWVIVKTPDTADLEARKVRFAAATFTGITMLFVFAACLYFAGQDQSKENPGREIFEKGLTAMFTLAGSIVGYLFGAGHSGARASTAPSTKPSSPPTASSDGMASAVTADRGAQAGRSEIERALTEPAVNASHLSTG